MGTPWPYISRSVWPVLSPMSHTTQGKRPREPRNLQKSDLKPPPAAVSKYSVSPRCNGILSRPALESIARIKSSHHEILRRRRSFANKIARDKLLIISTYVVFNDIKKSWIDLADIHVDLDGQFYHASLLTENIQKALLGVTQQHSVTKRKWIMGGQGEEPGGEDTASKE